jgi:ATP-dependent helicase/nuclease subunit A
MKPKTTKIRVPTPEQKQAADPNRSVWVAANAGSGKTQVLVDRVIRLLLDGADPQSILCLTYTKAAAAEMSNRLLQRLGQWIALDDATLDEELRILGVAPVSTAMRNIARRLFARALETPGGLKIQTIHAYCERLLHLFPVESGMAPGFRVMDEQEAKSLFRKALLSSLTPNAGSRQSVWDFLDNGNLHNLKQLDDLAHSFLSGSKGMRQRLADVQQLTEIEITVRQIFQIGSTQSAAETLLEICDIDDQAYQRAIKALMPLEADAKPSVPKLLQRILDEVTTAGRCEMFAELLLTEKRKPRVKILRVTAARAEPAIAAWLEDERQRVLTGLEKLAVQQTLEANLSLYKALAGVLTQVNFAKREQGIYDFDDLIARTAKLLGGSESAQWVLYKLDKGLHHILIDEAQDTSPAQWEIIKALAGEFFTTVSEQPSVRSVFAVGDLKQSIFSFQGADTKAFATARDHFKTTLSHHPQPLRQLDLAISYRSSQTVLDVVDAVFATGQQARNGFGETAETERSHEAYHKDREGMVEFWDTETADETEDVENWKAPVDRLGSHHPRLKLANRMATAIASWIGKRKLSGHDKTVSAGDILILLQKRGPLFSSLIAALRRHGVAVAGADRLQLQESLIAKDLLMLGQFLRMPTDDHALACLLKSPLMPQPLGEVEIMDLAVDRGNQSLWDRLPAASQNKQLLSAALQTNDTCYQFFADLLQRAKRHILERLGPEAQDAAEEFLTLALDYEQRHGTSLLGFVTWLSEDETTIKREMDQRSHALRIMTVHGAKGLEAPIVFLADIADQPSRGNGSIIRCDDAFSKTELQLFLPKTLYAASVIDTLKESDKDRARAERLRLLYVGMTRAADELYLCGSINKEDVDGMSAESWHPHLQAAFDKPENFPGLRRVEDPDGHSLLRFGAEPQVLIGSVETEAERPDMPQWALNPVTSAPLKPIRYLASRNSDAFDKPAVTRGIAIHRLLELMAEAAPESRFGMGQEWAKRLGLDDPTTARLAAALQDESLQPLYGEEGQSEVTIEGVAPGLGPITGRLDRMAIVGKTIYLLDYKTNGLPPQTLGAHHPYSQQMARYAALLKEAYPAYVIKAALLWTATGRLDWLEPDLLSRALDQMTKETT